MRECNRVEIMINTGDDDKYVLTFYLFENMSLTNQFIELCDKIQNIYVNHTSHITQKQSNSRPTFSNIYSAINDLTNFIKQCHKRPNTCEQYNCEIYYQEIDDKFLKHVFEKECLKLKHENTQLKNKVKIYENNHL
jgi:methylthioribose-1-phosphate isomerase